MKTFLKVLLLVVVALIAIKLLPLTIALGFVTGVALVALIALGLSLVGGVIALVVVLAGVLAPVWIPALLVIGLIALVRSTRKSGAVAA